MAASTVPEGRKTTSSCTPEIEQCSHVFEIHGYKLHEGLGVARALCSAASAVGGYEWTISYYSDGYWGQESSGYASVFVDFRSNKACPKGAKVRAFVRFGVVDPATGACEYITRGFHIKHTVLDPTIASHSWGFGKFIKKLHVVYPKYLTFDDRLTIVCNLSVVVGDRVSGPETTACENEIIEVPPSNLSDNLGKLLDTKEGVDVTFQVKGVVFHAHKVVLAARSPVFKAERFMGSSVRGRPGMAT
ncbi:BTB/POZ and MATH domain-containing protein 4-like [Miscanthus floridulus]|uniref:BTB/POZ and MATH domain-containing protein 4-like n=1 Tax=Miscanthus floridulus TaxID=154761 RepID=UPI0034591ACF